MSGRGKQGGKVRAKAKSGSSRASLQFSMGRIHRLLRKSNYTEQVRAGAPVSMAAVLEYLTAEILELADNTAAKQKDTSSRVTHNWPSVPTRPGEYGQPLSSFQCGPGPWQPGPDCPRWQ